jgi:hypothetical protein
MGGHGLGGIVRAAIHPAIGVARVGNSRDAWFLGPEVEDPPAAAPGFYRDPTGALKRQAARFRIYGYDAAGAVVAELTADDAAIAWTVHLRNEKAAWYQFQIAMDIPEAANAQPAGRRNAAITGADRGALVIDAGARSIAGANAGGPAYALDGAFMGAPVHLGDLKTDEAGRLVVLGGRGASGSPMGAPLTTFANNDGWHDDTADGPVTATLSIGGRAIPVDPAWVVVAPPNYAPNLKTLRTMHDLIYDLFVQQKELPPPMPVSFARDIQPIFERMSGLQWLNAGFAQTFGHGRPLDFGDPDFLRRMSEPLASEAETRRQIANSFRDFAKDGPSRTPFPWFYGDAPSAEASSEPRQNLALSGTQLTCLRQWAMGQFVPGLREPASRPSRIEDAPLSEQPAMLDRAALDFCLADAFHPGCEMTWPMRHSSLYAAPYRIRHRPANDPEPDYGDVLTPAVALGPGGPLEAQAPGGLTRWMATPWQTDTASCLSGYDASYDPYLPTFWPARVPNQVLYEPEYEIATDATKPRADRLAAFRTRGSWPDALPGQTQDEKLAAMIYAFPAMGIVEERPGVAGDPELPPVMQVSTYPMELLFPPEPGLPQPQAMAAPARARATVRAPHAGRFRWRQGDGDR